jgi:hypothetical protein
MNKIWIIDWNTESGDSGVDGYWKSNPTKETLEAYVAEHFPEDHEAGTFYYRVITLSEVKK